MKLNKLSSYDLKVGLRVVHNLDSYGTIIAINKTKFNEIELTIQWDDGKLRYILHELAIFINVVAA